MEQIVEGMLDGVGASNINKVLRTMRQTTRGNVALSKLLEIKAESLENFPLVLLSMVGEWTKCGNVGCKEELSTHSFG
jgi:hypothetical protein